MFYELVKNREIQQCVTGYPSTDVSFLSGEIIDPKEITQTIRVQGMFTADEPPGHFEFGKIALFSNYAVESLRKAGVDNIQDFPAEIVGEDGTEWKDYRAVQLIGLVRCANLEESDFHTIAPALDESMPSLCDFHEFIIDETKAPSDLMVFRVAEQPSIIIVSEALVDWFFDNIPEGGWGLEFLDVI